MEGDVSQRYADEMSQHWVAIVTYSQSWTSAIMYLSGILMISLRSTKGFSAGGRRRSIGGPPSAVATWCLFGWGRLLYS